VAGAERWLSVAEYENAKCASTEKESNEKSNEKFEREAAVNEKGI